MDPFDEMGVKPPFVDPLGRTVGPSVHMSMPMPMPYGWPHIPPQTMPWSMNPAPPSLVRFTGEQVPHQFMPHSISNLHSKRKADLTYEMPPVKQLITEEKMAANLSKLHISEQATDMTANMNLSSMTEMPDSDIKLPKLVVCEELRRLQQEPIIPQCILNKLERPKMALVLWQPPAGQLHMNLKNAANKIDEKKKREGETVLEVEMESEDYDENVFRPIDPVYTQSPHTFS